MITRQPLVNGIASFQNRDCAKHPRLPVTSAEGQNPLSASACRRIITKGNYTLKTMNHVKMSISILLLSAVLVVMTACGENTPAVSSQPVNSRMACIVGQWNEVSVNPRLLTVNEDGTYTLDEEHGRVKLDYENHSDGSTSLWYVFIHDDGEVFAYFPKDPENEVQTILLSDQNGEIRFIRDGMDEHLTADDYLHKTWSSGKCCITMKKEKKGYRVSVSRSDSASGNTLWTYYCTFDRKTSSMICKEGAIRVEVSHFKRGKKKTKTVYKDGSGTFFIKSGTLRWIDNKENAGSELYFVETETAG